eukprot:6002219-Heterocapsa_arctica.AAC.1
MLIQGYRTLHNYVTLSSFQQISTFQPRSCQADFHAQQQGGTGRRVGSGSRIICNRAADKPGA